MKSEWQQLQQWIQQSNQIVFFGGAGVSTESGIPDFRGEKGIFQTMSEYGYRPEQILSHSFFCAKPDIFFDYYKQTLLYPDAQPNDCHIALANLEQQGKLRSVVTQNIDGLHQKAGSVTVRELHGTLYRNYCVDCKKTFPLDFIVSQKGITRCDVCGGIVRPDVVLYEESLPEDTIMCAVEDIAQADLLIVGGTSLNVYPAAGFLRYFTGKHIVLINKTPTPFDQKADLIIRDNIGEVFSAIVLDKKNKIF